MMKLHVFNPEHDISLATNVWPFTAPHAARRLRADLGFLPALWAGPADLVLVSDTEAALESVRHLARYVKDVVFVSPADLRSVDKQMLSGMEVDVWGWDKAIAHELRKLGLTNVPSDQQLSLIRNVSSREWCARNLLPRLLHGNEQLVGKAVCISSFQQLDEQMVKPDPCVLKAPWSCSGRGIRYISSEADWNRNLSWARNVIRQQGALMVEPYYNKVVDFGMEFVALADGSVSYEGLSLFKTVGGAYVGSVLASEIDKLRMLSKYVGQKQVELVISLITSSMHGVLQEIYEGPFGIDMMVVAMGNGRLALHPCVELNLRRTMGHVALSFDCNDRLPTRLMQIALTDKYRLRVSLTGENLINNSIL